MTGLAREVKEEASALDQASHRMGIPHIGNVDANLLPDISHIEEVAAVFWNQTIHQRHLGSEKNQSTRQGRANKPQAACNQNVLSSKLFEEG